MKRNSEKQCRHPYVENPTGQPERTNEAAGVYAKACTEVSRELGLPVIDLWTKMQQLPDWKKAYLRYIYMLAYYYICQRVVC